MKIVAFGLASALALSAAVPAFAQTTEAKAGTELNVRAEPTPFAALTGVLAVNDVVSIEGCLEDVSWCKITSGETVGWASGQYLYVEDNANAVPLINMAGDAEKITIITTTEETTSQGDQNLAAAATGTIGALTAFALGGPIGAIIAGGVAGTAVGAAVVEPSEETIAFITANPVETVYLDGEVVTGAVIPSTVTSFELPQPELRYLVINNVPVLIDAETGTIVRIVR